jgi:hypothetical protein
MCALVMILLYLTCRTTVLAKTLMNVYQEFTTVPQQLCVKIILVAMLVIACLDGRKYTVKTPSCAKIKTSVPSDILGTLPLGYILAVMMHCVKTRMAALIVP